MFQPYLLVHLLQRKQNVLFSPDGKKLVLFYFGEVYISVVPPERLIFPQSRGKDFHVFLWSLFDVRQAEEPILQLICHGHFPVQTASPEESRYTLWHPWGGKFIPYFIHL